MFSVEERASSTLELLSLNVDVQAFIRRGGIR